MPDTAGINYALYASVQGNAPKYYAGYFNGDVHATGTVTWVSDARFKNNAENIEGRYALATLQKLEPKSYTFNRDAYPYLTLPQGNQYGLLAQDLEQVLPNLVSDIIHPETTDK
ncbi:MAG TPA: tail fiber domain-containing protein, partial [Chitinophagales bacterium]|nr:tail fiber domain-containing protein [Chitinophagales bacterium]